MSDAMLHTIKLPYPDKGDRTVWVYVPSHNDGEKLHVVYMTDGQNLFNENSTPHGSWEVVKAVENEQKNGVGGAVIVGIDNGNVWRDSELTPNSVGEVQHRDMLCEDFKPEGEIFDGFLMNTVIPYVENNFPVCTDRQRVAVCGSSSGGLMSFFSAVEHHEKFGYAGVFSPAFLCYTRVDWEKYLQNKIAGNMPYLYIYTGNGDELEEMIFESTEKLYELLEQSFYPYDRMNEVILFENQHNEKAWREIFPDFLHTFLSRL